MTTPLHITYSADRELAMAASASRAQIKAAIDALAEDPHPPYSTKLRGMGGCYYLTLGDYYVMYVADDDGVNVVGVLHGNYHPLH